MNIDFALFLVIAVVLTGLISLTDHLFFKSSERKSSTFLGKIAEYSRSLFPVFLIVLLIRSFLAEPFRIPSGSLEPTLLVGDFVLVNKYTYGLRLPLTHDKVLSIQEPSRGDVVVFRWPPNKKIDYIKRFVAVPGDHVVYKNKVLTINGKRAKQRFIDYALDRGAQGSSWKVEVREENLLGIKHKIYVRPDVPAHDFDITVPKGSYFAMGDNRDDSSDSRYWGFVPEANLLGKAFAIWMSWNGRTDSIRWQRIGRGIH